MHWNAWTTAIWLSGTVFRPTNRSRIKEDGSVIYELRISDFGTDTDHLIQLMKNWLDLF